MRNEKRPIQGNELFEKIIMAAGIEEEKYYLDYILADNHANINITYPSFDIETVVKWGSNEGIYCDVYIVGSYDEETIKTRNRLHIGTIKTLVESEAQMMRMYHMAGLIYLLGTKYINEIIDD